MSMTNDQMESEILQLKRDFDRGPSRVGGGGAGLGVGNVSTLPAIPASGYRVVYHTVEKQWFAADSTATYWTPLWDWTTNNGAPGS